MTTNETVDNLIINDESKFSYIAGFDSKKIIQDMVDFIKCKTVSNRVESLVDRNEFTKLINMLPEKFPTLFKMSEYLTIGKTGLLFHISGTQKQEEKINTKIKTAVLMAHYDVVPADEKEWDKPPFSGEIEQGVLWGRGTLDTKGTFCSVLEAVELFLASGKKPSADLYLSFSGEEEIDGESCSDIVKWLKENNIQPDFVLDEGGAIVDKILPGVKCQTAMIGVAEKGSLNVNCTIPGTGGHASAPPTHTATGIAAKAVCAVEKNHFKFQLTESVAAMFKTLAPASSGIYKFLFSHPRLFSGLFKLLSNLARGELYAMMHTTCAVTCIEASKAFNVIPNQASFGMNLRLLGTDTITSVVQQLEKAVKKAVGKNATVSVVNGMNPSIESKMDGIAWNTLTSVITKTWPSVAVSPYLMMACSDSRHYCAITDKVYRFSGMYMTKEERGTIHGKNERIPIQKLLETVQFYCNLLEML